MPKEKCKYWDKCYQKNSIHLQKYIHPEKHTENNESDNSKETHEQKELACKNVNSSENAICKQYDTKRLPESAVLNTGGIEKLKDLQYRIKLSEQKEYDNLVQSIDFIHHKFLVEMPEEFYEFWVFLQHISKKNGEEVLLTAEKNYNLMLVGPFEFLAGKFEKAEIHSPGDYLRHWRFYYDPPEFQTVFVLKGTGIHYGYWRDTPQDKCHLLIARNDSMKNCEFQFVGGNMFEAFHYYLENDYKTTPFSTNIIGKMKKHLHAHIEEKRSSHGLDTLLKKRNKNVVCKTFHRAGIVVPFDTKTSVGYRPLIQSDAQLKKILKVLEGREPPTLTSVPSEDLIERSVKEKLHPIVTAATIAVDECDFGTALELGIDLFCSGLKELHPLVTNLLVQAYSVLKRPQFIAVIKSHLENRSKSINLSVFN